MKEYRGVKYFLGIDGLWRINIGEDCFFIVALDDSKNCGYRKIINQYNNEETCIKYIDWKKNIDKK